MRIWGLAMVLMVAGSAQAQVPAGFGSAWQAAEAAHAERMQNTGVVGGSAMLLHDRAVVAEMFYGYADRAAQRLVDARTIYHWASITKTFTGIAILQLRDRGLLTLDDPVVAYLPELHQVHNLFGPMDAITIRHLLSHAAGFRGSTWPWGGGEPWHPHEPKTWDQLVAMLPYTQILFPPGTESRYSNPGIIFLGRIIEILSGDDYEVYIDKNILKPLGMHASYFDHTPYHLLPFRSDNYFLRDGAARPNGLDFDTGITVSNGGLNAPMTDMVKYLNFLVGEPGNTVYEGVLARASLEAMWEPLYPLGDDGYGPEYRGLTFFLIEAEGRRYIGHTGSQQGFLSFFYLDPATQTAALAAVNTTDLSGASNTRALLYELRADVLRRLFPLFE